MREVAEKVAEVEAGRGDLGNHHLEESGEGREDAKLLSIKTETGGSAEVAALRDA